MNETSTDKFLEALMGEDTLGAVIRAHIHIEQHLNEIIDALLSAPKEIKSMNLEYSQKVNLAVAIGLHGRLKRPLLTLGTIRNGFAHRVDAALTKSDVDNFYKAFDLEEKEVIHKSYEATKMKSPNGPKQPLSKLQPKDRFILYSIALRGALLTALSEVKQPKAN